MLKRLMMITGLAMLTTSSWAQSLDKDSSFTVELDNATGMWALECELEVDGIEAFADHFVSASVQYQVEGTTAITIARSDFDIFGSERRKSELTDGFFAFKAKKMGDRLSVGINLSWPVDLDADGLLEGFFCVINVSRTTEPSGGLAGLNISQVLR